LSGEASAPSGPRGRRALTFAIAGLGVLLLLAFSFAPHYAAWSMKRAADANDLPAFAERVDLQSVRESLKAARRESGPITKGLAGRLASRAKRLTLGAFTDKLVDRLVTHERLARAIRGDAKPRDGARANEDPARQLDLSMRYESPNRFVITVRDPNAEGEPVGLVFGRRGVFDWKLVAIRM
jgi:hypothetical protein